MNVKNLFRRTSSIGASAVHYLRARKCLGYLILAVLLQCLPFSVEAAPSVEGQKGGELGTSAINLAAENWEFRKDIEIPTVFGRGNLGDGSSKIAAKRSSGGRDSPTSVAETGEVVSNESSSNNSQNKLPTFGDKIDDFFHGVWFALPIVALIFAIRR
jgi:hypothetical protein